MSDINFSRYCVGNQPGFKLFECVSLLCEVHDCAVDSCAYSVEVICDSFLFGCRGNGDIHIVAVCCVMLGIAVFVM